MARPSKLTADKHEQIVQLVRAGVFLVDAAEFSQVGRATVYRWIGRGDEETRRLSENPSAKPKKEEKPYVAFRDAIAHARAYAKTSATSTS